MLETISKSVLLISPLDQVHSFIIASLVSIVIRFLLLVVCVNLVAMGWPLSIRVKTKI